MRAIEASSVEDWSVEACEKGGESMCRRVKSLHYVPEKAISGLKQTTEQQQPIDLHKNLRNLVSIGFWLDYLPKKSRTLPKMLFRM